MTRTGGAICAVLAGTTLGSPDGVLSTSSRGASREPRVRWDLVACGRDGDGPFRLELHYAHGSFTEYYVDVASAFRAIEEAEKGSVDPLVPDRQMIEIPDDRELIRQCSREEVWFGAARH